MSRQNKLVKNTLILSIGTILPKFGTIITLPILTGSLTQAEYGTFDLVSVLGSLILPSVTLQIQVAAFRFLIEVEDDEEEKNSIITTISLFSICVSMLAILMLFCILPLNNFMTKLLICGYFFADNMVKTCRQIARGLSKTISYSISAMISTLCKIGFTIAFVSIVLWKLNGALLALFISSIISFIFLLFDLKLWKNIEWRLFSFKQLKKLLEFSWPMVPVNVSMWIIRLSDRLIVTLAMGITANAVYSVANKIPSLLTLGQNTFALAWQESASIASKDEDAPQYYSQMFRTMYDIMAGFLGIIIAGTPVLFPVLIRGDYDAAYVQIPILVMAMFFYSMSDFIGGVFIAYKQSKIVGVTTALAAIINLAVNVSLIKFIGLFAASLSTLISYMMLFLLRMITVKKYVKIDYNLKHMVLVLLVLVVECVFCSFQLMLLDIVNILISIVVFYCLNKKIVIMLLNKGRKMLRRE